MDGIFFFQKIRQIWIGQALCFISFSGDVSNKSIKEIGGLEERLGMLSKLCDRARILGQEQSDMAQVILFSQVWCTVNICIVFKFNPTFSQLILRN